MLATTMFIVVGFLLVILLVVLHEAGHFFAARRNKIEVEEFGIGFPPRAKVLTKKNGTEYTLNWLPLGGFVKLKGEHDSDTEKGSYGAASLKGKVQVMLAGVVVNFFIAYLLFTIIALIGMPRLVPNQFTVASDTNVIRQDVLVGFIAEDSPASKAEDPRLKGTENEIIRLEINDVINRVSLASCQDFEASCSYEINEPDDLKDATQMLARAEENAYVVLDITRVDENYNLYTNLLTEDEVAASRETDEPKGYLGVVPNEFALQRSTWSAPIVGAGITLQFTQLTLEGLWSIVSGLFQGDVDAATEQVAGFVGVGFIFANATTFGFVFLLMIVAVISLSLAVMNTLPIPALDGGRLFVTLLYRIRNKPLTKEIEEKIHGRGFVALLFLMLLITIVDVQRFF